MAMSISHRAAVRSCPKEGAGRTGKAGRYQRQELITAVGGAALVLVIGVLAVWAHHSLSTARPVASQTDAPPPVHGAAPSLTSAPTRGQLSAWLTQAEPSINALVSARSEIASPAANDDIAGTGAACQTADDAVANLQNHLPSPDPALNTALQQVIDDYHVGLRYCIAGARNHDANDIQRATAYIHQGNVGLQAAFDILDRDLPDAEPGDSGVVTV